MTQCLIEHGIGGAGGIDFAFLRCVFSTDQSCGERGCEAAQLARAENLVVDAEAPFEGRFGEQEFHRLGRVGDHQSAFGLDLEILAAGMRQFLP